jgi:DNA-binding CsgD family transcriptional regulator
LTKALPRLPVGAAAPEERRDLLAGYTQVAAHGQIGDQRAALLGRDPDRYAVLADHLEAAEKANTHLRQRLHWSPAALPCLLYLRRAAIVQSRFASIAMALTIASRSSHGRCGEIGASTMSGNLMDSTATLVPAEAASFDCAHAVVAALELIGLPAALLADSARPVALNQAFEALMPNIVIKQCRRLRLVNTAANAMFARALGRQATAPQCTIAIPGAGDRPPMVMHVMRLDCAMQRKIPAAETLAVVKPVTGKDVFGVELLRGSFQLTQAEARVAHAVAQGRTSGDIAASLGLSRETVRSQIKAALAKTGAARNIDLAVLLADTSLCTPYGASSGRRLTALPTSEVIDGTSSSRNGTGRHRSITMTPSRAMR